MDVRGSVTATLFSSLLWGCCGKAKERRCPSVTFCVAYDHGHLPCCCHHLGHACCYANRSERLELCSCWSCCSKRQEVAEVLRSLLISIHFSNWLGQFPLCWVPSPVRTEGEDFTAEAHHRGPLLCGGLDMLLSSQVSLWELPGPGYGRRLLGLGSG